MARARDESAEVNALLPLPVATFHILLAVADEPRHGYAISQDIAARTSGAIKMSFGTLYRSIQRMLEHGLLEEVRESPTGGSRDDERRRYYRVTRFGRVVARAEVERLADLVRLASATSFALKRG
jgi:DNA-binding PadR family transcriptional regulator